MSIVKFVDLLAAQAEAIGDRRNAPHTRLRIQLETVALLQEAGYDKLNISAICEKVGLTRPGLYLHYKNKEEIVLDLLRALVKAEAQLAPSLTDCKNLSETTTKVCDWYLRFHLGSGALFATLTEIRRSVPEAYELWNDRSRNLLETFGYQFSRFDEFREIDSDWATFAIESVARSMNVTVDRISSHPGPVSRKYSERVDELITLFSRLMYQSLLGKPFPIAEQS